MLRARRQLLLGYGQLLKGNRKEAAETFRRARGLTPATPAADDVRFDIDILDGVVALQLGRRDQGESQLKDVLRAATAKGDRYHEASALLNLGYGQLVQKRYDAALTWLERALAFTDQQDTTIYAEVLNNAGLCYARLGQFDRAVTVQRQAVDATRAAPPGMSRPSANWGRLSGCGRIAKAAVFASGAEWRRAGLAAMQDLGRKSGRAHTARQLDAAERFNGEANASSRSGSTVSLQPLRARTSPSGAAARRASRLFDEALGSAGRSERQWSA